jgi:hypothetical protein
VLTNCELRCVHGNRNASCSGRQVVAGKGALAVFVKVALAVQGQRMRGNHHAGPEFFSQGHQNFPSRV